MTNQQLVTDLLSWFRYTHLPDHLQLASKPFHDLAHAMAAACNPNDQLIQALRKMIEAKDCYVRSMMTTGTTG